MVSRPRRKYIHIYDVFQLVLQLDIFFGGRFYWCNQNWWICLFIFAFKAKSVTVELQLMVLMIWRGLFSIASHSNGFENGILFHPFTWLIKSNGNGHTYLRGTLRHILFIVCRWQNVMKWKMFSNKLAQYAHMHMHWKNEEWKQNICQLKINNNNNNNGTIFVKVGFLHGAVRLNGWEMNWNHRFYHPEHPINT